MDTKTAEIKTFIVHFKDNKQVPVHAHSFKREGDLFKFYKTESEIDPDIWVGSEVIAIVPKDESSVHAPATSGFRTY